MAANVCPRCHTRDSRQIGSRYRNIREIFAPYDRTMSLVSWGQILQLEYPERVRWRQATPLDTQNLTTNSRSWKRCEITVIREQKVACTGFYWYKNGDLEWRPIEQCNGRYFAIFYRIGATTDGVTLFFKTDDLFYSSPSGKWWPFLAVVSSPLPSSHVVYPVFFLNSATKN